MFLLNVTIRGIRLCWDNNTARNLFNLITSKYFNLYSTVNKNGRGKNSLLNNLTVIYSHLEEKRSGAIGSGRLNIFYKEDIIHIFSYTSTDFKIGCLDLLQIHPLTLKQYVLQNTCFSSSLLHISSFSIFRKRKKKLRKIY